MRLRALHFALPRNLHRSDASEQIDEHSGGFCADLLLSCVSKHWAAALWVQLHGLADDSSVCCARFFVEPSINGSFRVGSRGVRHGEIVNNRE